MCNYIFQQLMHCHKSKINLLEMHKIRQFGGSHHVALPYCIQGLRESAISTITSSPQSSLPELKSPLTHKHAYLVPILSQLSMVWVTFNSTKWQQLVIS